MTSNPVSQGRILSGGSAHTFTLQEASASYESASCWQMEAKSSQIFFFLFMQTQNCQVDMIPVEN